MAILQKSLPYTPWADPRLRRLPGIMPLEVRDWIWVDDAYAAQMAERDRMMAEIPEQVLACDPSGQAAAQEALDTVLAQLSRHPGFVVTPGQVTRADGVVVPLDRDRPLQTAGRLIQEDLCLMQKQGSQEHLLTGAVLCFPAGWTLAEKMMQPMMRIHLPVEVYGPELARRVQRLLDGIRPQAPLWRANVHYASTADLFTPRSEHSAREGCEGQGPYIRSERQCLLRLPRTDAVLFSIHTFMIETQSLSPSQRAALRDNPIAHEAARTAV